MNTAENRKPASNNNPDALLETRELRLRIREMGTRNPKELAKIRKERKALERFRSFLEDLNRSTRQDNEGLPIETR